MTHTKALSVLDLAFFLLENRERMSNVGPIVILKPPPGTRSSKRFADSLLRRMQKRPVGAPFHYRYHPPGAQGLPRLEVAENVDPAGHCHRISLPAPATDAQLFAHICRIHEKRLDRARPLWEFYVIDGLAHGRIALYAKVHHGIIDGMGFLEICTRWFTADAADRKVRALWEGLPPRSLPDLGKPHPGAAESLMRKVVALGATTASLYTSLAKQAMASAGLANGMPLPFVGTPSALRARPSVRRSFGHCRLPLAALKAFGKAHDASVNDMLLTVLDMALNRYLEKKGRGADQKPLVADMPVALPSSGQGGNSIAVLQFPLGAAVADPLERLRTICKHTAKVKQHVKAGSATALATYTAAVHGIPALFELLNFPDAPMLANMVISNPTGVKERRYLAGAEVEMMLPLSLLAPGQSLNITAVTYGDGLQIAFLGLAAELPDIQLLADFSVDAFAELTAPVKPIARARPRGTTASRKAKAT